MSSTSLTLSDAETEIVTIRCEMHHIESTVERPLTLPHYVGLSQRLNAAASTTCRLPREILSLIFQCSSSPPHYVPDAHGKKRPFHLTLRSVSSHWYNVVQSTPQLWTHATSLGKSVNEDFARYLKLCLDNSGHLPLTIRLSFGASHLDSPYLVSPLVDATLRYNLCRIRVLQLLDAHNMWLTVIPLMFELTSLRLTGMNANTRRREFVSPLNLSKNTKINDLSLSHLLIGGIKLGPSTSLLTQLGLYSIPIDICMRLYLECQHVNDFQCSSPRYPLLSAVPKSPTHILTHNSLLSLSWDLLGGNLTRWNDYILKWTHFPVLQILWWKDNKYRGAEYDLTEFLSHLPQSLNTLGFSSAISPTVLHATLIDHIHPDSDVSKIVLSGCNEHFLNSIFQSLFKKTTADGGEVVPFPRLVYISADISNFGELHVVSSVVGENLVRLLEERKDIINEFTFHHNGNFDNWEAETWRRLDELRTGGLTINILT